MNINYAQIIETANKRKDALLALEAILKHTPEALQHAEHVLTWATTLANAWAAVDGEGKKMLPVEVFNQLNAMPLTSMKAVVDGALVNGQHCGLRRLHAALGNNEG